MRSKHTVGFFLQIDIDMELLTAEAAEQDPAGLGRKEPQPLDFPKYILTLLLPY